MVSWIRTESRQFLAVSAFDFVSEDEAIKTSGRKKYITVYAFKIDAVGDLINVCPLFTVTVAKSVDQFKDKFMVLLTDPDHGPILDVCMEVL